MFARSELNIWWRIGLAGVGAVFGLGFRTRVAGTANVPARGPAVIAGNHLSALDGVFIGLVVGKRRKRMTRFLSGIEFFRRPLIGRALRIFGQIPIRRGERDTAAIEEAVRTIRRGAVAGVFPEGRVSPDPEVGLQPGKRGIARIALAAGAPVVPVGIWGPQRRWPREGLHFRRPWRPRVALSFGEPIQPTGDVTSADDLRKFTDAVMTSIGKQVEIARAMAGGRR